MCSTWKALNDVVGGITNVRVWETVPDTAFDDADEVVLVDIPADELLERLKAGKVYVPHQAERAASNFFRKGNLMALRELALRRTADRVEGDVQAYRVDKSIESVWKTANALLTCVGPDAGAERVVRAAARLAGQWNAEWHAVYVETPGLQRLPAARREKILGTLRLAKELGATTAVIADADVATQRDRLRPQPQSVEAGHRPRSGAAAVAVATVQRAETGDAGAGHRSRRDRASRRRDAERGRKDLLLAGESGCGVQR